ncbi:MAG: type II toxin-antitoxin system RelE/ParE family toxin [Chlorobium limicola]|uniref:Toxin n=1 Tax=Chlorobium limicola (strain DSM 245 / NBRC 103803 / 6330) TaxID=290315 RepID=B3EG53_CHLL2|nr:type II toxin-antitoxin system RelE/ParE family toxin [Chlorobium limicola]ACD91062.1 plasmid stabilization system [Chlorobium limicola DSM 245]NTV20976.1 type II toxin-antitoxin system RelE/ParE family toxin [Chlorobium limicola]
MPKIIIRPLVVEDLAEIWSYIAEDSSNRADSFVDFIDGKFHELAQSPRIGRSRNELLPGLCSFPVGRYIIFYLIIPDGIEVVRVLHASRDIDDQLNPQQ